MGFHDRDDKATQEEDLYGYCSQTNWRGHFFATYTGTRRDSYRESSIKDAEMASESSRKDAEMKAVEMASGLTGETDADSFNTTVDVSGPSQICRAECCLFI